MQVTETLFTGLKRGFTVKVPARDMESKHKTRLVELAASLKLPGFRPGKVPVSVVQQRYGATVTTEIVEQTINDNINAVLGKHKIRSASQPVINIVSGGDTGKNEDLEFSFELEVLPDITIPDLSALSLNRLMVEMTDEVVTKASENIARQQREFTDVEEIRPLQSGDIAVVDYDGKMEGKPFDGGSAKDIRIEIGGADFIPGFVEQMEGMSVNEKREINVTFPPDYHVASLAGKEAVFSIFIKKIQIATSVKLDDELAKKLGFNSLEELTALVKKQIKSEYEQMSRVRIKRDLLDRLDDLISFDVPISMVEGEFSRIWERLEQNRKENKLDAEDMEKDEKTLKEDYRKIAERRVRLGLLMSEIGQKNNIVVTESEFASAVRMEAMRYPGQEKKIIEFFQKNPQATDSIRGPIFENKVIDFILARAKIEDKVVTLEELAKSPSSV